MALQIISEGAFDATVRNQINQNFQMSTPFITGNIIYLDPLNGFDGNSGQYPSQAFKTLATAYNALREGKNDVIALIGNGLTTATARVSSAFTWAKNAAHMVGISSGSFISDRARIAPNGADTAFANFFTISSSGCLFQNLQWFHGFNTGTTAAICLTITGGRNSFINCDIDGMGDAASAADAGSRSLLIQTTGENYFSHCEIGIDTVTRTNANASVQIKATGCPRNIFEDCIFPFYSGDGASLGILISAGNVDRFQLFKRCTFINAIQSGATAMAVLASQPASQGGMLLMDNCVMVGVTEWGDTGSDTQMYVAGPAVSSSMGIAVNPAT